MHSIDVRMTEDAGPSEREEVAIELDRAGKQLITKLLGKSIVGKRLTWA